MTKWSRCQECERPSVAKGRCKAHYDRYRKEQRAARRTAQPIPPGSYRTIILLDLVREKVVVIRYGNL